MRWLEVAAWMALVTIASIAVLPYLREILRPSGKPVDTWDSMFSMVFERMQMSAVAVCGGILLRPKTGLGWLKTDAPGNTWKSLLAVSVACGFVVGTAVGFASPWLSTVLLPELPETYRQVEAVAASLAPWKTLLAAFSAGVIEEIVCRWGLMTSLVYAGMRLTRQTSPPPKLLWAANGASAVLFGLLHLSNVVSFGIPITIGTITYVIIGNGFAGIVFGWLYVRRGLASAIIAHTVADIALKILVPLVT